MKVGSFLAAAACLMASVALADSKVGPLGDPARWTIQGAAAFPVEEIKSALSTDLQVLLAAHPLAPRGEMAPVIQKRLLAGYLKAGFADATVQVALDEAAETLTAAIVEGPRYKNGEVRILGVRALSGDELHARLTQPFPPKEAVQGQFFQRGDVRETTWFDKDNKPLTLSPPVWKSDQSTRFDAGYEKSLRDQVQQALVEFGYPFAEYAVDVTPDPATGLAELTIEIADEGAAAEVQEIEIVGAEKNTRADILAFLEIKPGELITHRRRMELEQRLWESARFINQRVIITPPENGSPAKLRLELKEYAHAPPLRDNLSREEAALLKTRNWINEFLRTSEMDIVLRQKIGESPKGSKVKGNGTVCLVFSPRHGIVASAGVSMFGAKPASLGGFLLSGDEFGVYNAWHNWRFAGSNTRFQFVPRISFVLNEETLQPPKVAEASKKTAKYDPFSIQWNFGYRTLKAEESPAPVNLGLDLSPVYCLAHAHELNAHATWQDHILTLQNDEQRLRIDERDGRILEKRRIKSDGTDDELQFELVGGEFERQKSQLLTSAPEMENLYEPERPITSTILAITRDDIVQGGQKIGEWMRQKAAEMHPENAPEMPSEEKIAKDLGKLRFIRTLAERGIFRPFDEYLVWSTARAQRGKPDTFSILPDFDPAAPPMQMIGQMAVAWVLPVAERCFPRESWPWTLSRESALAFAGKTNYLQPALGRLCLSPDTGPLTCLATASLMQLAKIPSADVIATRGLADTSAEAFVRDCQPFLDRKALVGQCVYRAAEAIRALDEAESQELFRGLFKDHAEIFDAAARELRRDPQLPLEDALPRALAAAWDAGLRTRVEAALEAQLPADTYRIGARP